MTDLWLSGVFFQALNSKTRFRPGLCPGPCCGSLWHSPRPSSRWRGGQPLRHLVRSPNTNSWLRLWPDVI